MSEILAAEKILAEKPNIREILFEPNRKQWLFLRAKARYVAFGGARGGGKSWAIDTKAVLLANRWAGIKILIVRRTLVELRNNHIDRLKQMLRGLAKWNQQERKFIFGNGSTICFEYFDSEKDAFKYQGVEYDVIFIDEATQFPEEWLKIMATCCRGVNPFPKRVYFTCNPGGPGHAYIKRLFIDKVYRENENPEDYVFIQSLVTENKALMQYSPDYIKFLEALPPKLKKGWLYGDWDIFSGMYFEDWRNNTEGYDTRRWTHVINPFTPPRSWPIYRSHDWGSNKPSSTGWWTCDENGVLYRILELYTVQYSGGEPIPDEGTKWPAERLYREIARIENEHPYLAGKKITGIADPAIWQEDGGISLAETANKCGVYFYPGDNHRIPGWMQVKYRLMFDEDGFPQMYIFNTCKNFIRTITTLEYDEHAPEDLNTKGEDHAADETRYMCMWRPCKPPIETTAADVDWTGDPLEQMARRQRQ